MTMPLAVTTTTFALVFSVADGALSRWTFRPDTSRKCRQQMAAWAVAFLGIEGCRCRAAQNVRAKRDEF